jgi:hypothetical protein
MTIEIKGQIKLIGQPEVKSEKFTKQEIVITIDSDTNYPQHVPIQLGQKLLGVIGQFQVGQVVKATCNVRGNEWNSRYFLSLEAWKVEADGVSQAPVAQVVTPSTGTEVIESDLPF